MLSRVSRNCQAEFRRGLSPSRPQQLSTRVQARSKAQERFIRSARAYSSRYGQPHPSTHPHLLKSNEVAYGYPLNDVIQRRKDFAQALPPKSVAIFPNNLHSYMTNDIPYLYRTNSDLYYLSGFMEPESVLVIERKDNNEPHTTMFLRERDPAKELWDGPRTGVQRAAEFLGIDEVHAIDKLDKVLPDIVSRNKNVFYNDIKSDANTADILNQHEVTVIPLQQIIERQRLVKSPAEIAIMQQSCSISSNSFIEVMKFTKPGLLERHLEAKMEFECRMRGSLRLAYPPVVASGLSNLTLHYIDNDAVLQEGDLILMDAGGEFHNYASDITRTFPVNGKFTKPQLEIYSATLRVNEAICAMARTHVNGTPMTIRKLHEVSVRLICQELVQLGIMTPDTLRTYNRFYPHSIGHFLGMDVHDVSSIPYTEPLRPGMIITVEPGIYIPNDPDIPSQYRGIGVRIEDDVVITEGEPIILTREAPKKPEEIERIMQQARL